MLRPAILYKDTLDKKFAEQLYTDEYFWYSGYGGCNELPSYEPRDERYQYAIVDKDDNVIGYFAYQVQAVNDTVLNFGLYSFDKGNPLVGIDVFAKMEDLVKCHRRIEWRMIGGNKIFNSYKHFCERHNGNVIKLNQVTKDNKGEYHDEYIFEILKKGE